ncbi:MAG TPA: hypothetical protein VGJ95_17500 [Pseudonocardiaceae bacterium]
MSGTVVRWHRWRRWLAVAAGAATLLAVPAVVHRLPTRSAAEPSVQVLRERVLASGGQPYAGYAESIGQLGMPPLPQLADVATLLSGTVRVRAWYAAPDRWRVDMLTTAGERGTYRVGGTELVWDYEDDRLTGIIGPVAVRPPRAADLLPPELARRLLGLAAGDPVTALPPRRVAGIDAAGLRLTPSDPSTTVGAVEVWAEPASGLPLQVQVTARGADRPVLVSRLLEVSMAAPPAAVLRPSPGPGSAVDTVNAAEVAGVLRGLGSATLPARLAGRDLVIPSADLPSVGRYGDGLAGFVVVPLGRGLSTRLLDGARSAGAVDLTTPSIATAVRLQTPAQTPLLTVVVVRVRRLGYLMAGAVTAPVLEQAAAELAGGNE